MDQILQTLRTVVTDHGIKLLTAAAFTTVGWLIGRWRASRRWQRREFFNRLNVSLNSFQNGTLQIRTVMEKTCEEVFLNQVAVERLIRSAQGTTVQDPFVPIPREDRWFYLNAVLNELSERFADGLFRREAGKSGEAVRYVVCLTNECDGEVRTRKIRAMIIRKDRLLDLPKDPPVLEKPHHAIRWKTLQQMQKRFASDPDFFIEMDIVV